MKYLFFGGLKTETDIVCAEVGHDAFTVEDKQPSSLGFAAGSDASLVSLTRK